MSGGEGKDEAEQGQVAAISAAAGTRCSVNGVRLAKKGAVEPDRARCGLADFPGNDVRSSHGGQFVKVTDAPGHVEAFPFWAYPVNLTVRLHLDVHISRDTAGEVTARVE